MKTLLTTILLALAGIPVSAQTAVKVEDPGHVQVLFYNNSNLIQYVCEAPSVVDTNGWSVSDSTFTNVVVSSNVATLTFPTDHNLFEGAVVTLSGSATGALNGVYAFLTTPTSKTATVTTSGVPDGTYTTGLVVTTKSPFLTAPKWSVTVVFYTGSLLTNVHPGLGELSLAYRAKCSDRAKY